MNGCKKSKDSIRMGQYFDQSTEYMNGSIFSMTRYMIGVGFRNLGHTPVPQLPLSYLGTSGPFPGGYRL